MNRSDIEFTIGLNTSPAEQKLNELGNKVKQNGHIYNDVFKDVGQGFKMVGTPYQNSNNYGVPSVQVLERSVAVFSNVMERFARIVESMSAQMVNFTTVGRAYTPQNGPINMGSKVAGYLPHYYPSSLSESYNSRPLGLPSPDYAINANDIFDAIIKRRKAQEASFSPIYSMASEQFAKTMNPYGMYETWKNNFSFNMLGLPAPEKEDRETFIGAGGKSFTRRKRKDVEDIKKETQEEEKALTEENKKDNSELEEKVVKWGRIFAIIYGIRKLMQGLSKVFNFGAETVASANKNINEELGYFTVDPIGAMRANTDKTRSILYAGIRNLGENTPVSKSGLDYSAEKFTSIWTAAMSGRGVDQQTTIDIQRLKDYFGIDLSPAALLTGEREGKTATDLQIDMLQKIEKQFGILNKLSEEEKGQVIDSLNNVIGKEMLNAIVANINKNNLIQEEALKQTVVERLKESGGSAIHSKDLTEKTQASVTALGEFGEAIQNLKNTIVQQFSPVFVSLVETLTNGINYINKFLNRGETEKNAFGEADVATSVSALINGNRLGMNRYKALGKQKENDEKDTYKQKEELISKIGSGKITGRDLDLLYLSQPEVENAASIEGLMMSIQERRVGKAIKDKKLDPNSNNPIIKALAKHVYTNEYGKTFSAGYESIMQELTATGEASSELIRLFTAPEELNELTELEAYRLFFSSSVGKKYFKKAFDKGGDFDFNTSKGIFQYLANPLGFSDFQDYSNYIASLVNDMKQNKYYDNYMKDKDVETTWKDNNRNGKIDAGEVEITLVVKDEKTGKVIDQKPITFDVQ